MTGTLRTWAAKVAPKWYAVAAAALILAVSALFGGMRAVAAPRAVVAPTVAVNHVIHGGPWDVSVVNVRYVSSQTGLSVQTKGDRWLIVVAQIDITAKDSLNTYAEAVLPVGVPGLRATPGGQPGELLLASDGTPAGYLNPGMPERIGFAWEQDGTAPLQTTVKVQVYGEEYRTNSLTGNVEWLNPHVIAQVNAPTEDKR